MKITNKKLLNKFNRKKRISSIRISSFHPISHERRRPPNSQPVRVARVFFAMLLAIDRSLTGLYRRRISSRDPGQTKVACSRKQGTCGGSKQVATQGRKKHWPGKVFKSVIFPAISLSWCVASGLTGLSSWPRRARARGRVKFKQPLYLGSPSTPQERFMVRIK